MPAARHLDRNTHLQNDPRRRVPLALSAPHLVLAYAAFLAVSSATRIALLCKAGGDVSWDASLFATFALGLLYDIGAAALASLPVALLVVLLPPEFLARPRVRVAWRGALFVMLFALLFGAVAEWAFWDEFGARFNFIAVDYLVYTTEVIGNVRESYPLPWIFAGLLAATFVAWRLALRTSRSLEARAQPRSRWWQRSVYLCLPLAFGLALDEGRIPAFSNAYNRELAKNGVWSLLAAFRQNALQYDHFYRTVPIDAAFARLREELIEDGSVLLRPSTNDSLRYVENRGPELRLNVVQITVESLSAQFLGIFDPSSKLTPGLDEIAARSLVFENFYATGTRTDRGMEALTLSLPPTPGRSIIKRPRNADLFTLGSVFRTRGYDTAFLYGGFGYFDNMNAFFGDNGYRVVDRGSVESSDITFANAWGACDEDLLRWTLREADAVHARNTPFHFFVMTTSNHRPYTYPDGRIDLPSKTSGRAGAVKYTDFAIREFLRAAESRAWYRNTVFVIVADHCASSAGRTEVPVEKYHIPLIVFAPGGQIAPGRIRRLTSQMDYAPTLLGLLGWSYPSRFFGHDVRRVTDDEAHALVGNYQRLGHLEKGCLVVLDPHRDQSTYSFDVATDETNPAARSAYSELETIAFYQCASHMYESGTYRALAPSDVERFTRLGLQLAAAPAPAHAAR